MGSHYRHTQFGWVTLGAMAGAAVLMLVVLGTVRELPGAGLVALLVLLPGLLFGTLTVEVDAEELKASFTGGIVRRRVRLEEVRAVRVVRNPWYYGWGIHRVPGGWIWNVSGLDGVELALAGGSVWLVGTDEPVALARAVERFATHLRGATGDAPPAIVPDAGGARSSSGRGRLVAWAAVVVVGVVLFVLPFQLQTRDPQVRVTPSALSIDSLFYGQDYPLAEVTAVSLETCLPRVLRRSNGFAGGGLLRGWFVVEGLGRGKLFVDTGNGPFVLVRLRSGFVIVGFSQGDKARALHEQLQAALPPR